MYVVFYYSLCSFEARSLPKSRADVFLARLDASKSQPAVSDFLRAGIIWCGWHVLFVIWMLGSEPLFSWLHRKHH